MCFFQIMQGSQIPKQSVMFAMFLSLGMTVLQANQNIVHHRPFCQESEADTAPADVISGSETELLNDCMMLHGKNSSVNSTVTGLEPENAVVERSKNASVENSQGLLQFGKEIPDWKKTFNKIQYFVVGIYFPTVAIAAIVGNTIILLVLRKDVLQSSSSVYLTGLAVADMIFVINYSPKTLSAFEVVVASRTYQTFRAYWISYFFPLVSVCHTAAVWVTISFTLERYFAIAYPLKAQKYSTKTRARLAVLGAYVFAVVANALRFFRRHVVKKTDPVTQTIYDSYSFTRVGRDETLTALVFWSYFVLATILPFIILISFNSAIIWKVWLARKRRINMAENKPAKSEKSKYREMQTTRMLVSIVIAFLLCNVVAAAASAWVALNGANSVYTTRDVGVYYMFLFGPALYVTNPLVNCILYAACSSAVREGVRNLFCGRRFLPQRASSRMSFAIGSVRGRIWTFYNIGTN